MFEAFTHFLMQEHLYGMTFQPPNGPPGYARQLDPRRQPMATRDGFIAIAPYLDDRWVRFFEAAGRSDVLDREDLNTTEKRYKNVELMQSTMADIVNGRTTQEWVALLSKFDIPAFLRGK